MANEKRLIDVEQAKRATYEEVFWTESEQAVVRNFLAKLPKVDAEPVVHGHWVKYNFLGHEQWACSECQTLGSPQWKRCPVCEAKMDGERKDNGSNV